MNTLRKFKILFTVLLLCAVTSFGQTKKLVKSFKFGTVGYNLFTLSAKPNKGLNDTSFYLLYRVGNTKILAKVVKEISVKSNGNILASTAYYTYPKEIVFNLGDKNKKYTQNSKGLLKMEEYGVPMVVLAPPPPTVEAPVAYNTGNPEKVDVLPEYPGGINGARAYIARNVAYPEQAQENEIEGTINLTFVIAKDGSVTNIKIEKGLGYGLDEEVIRVVKRMPKWSPAKLKGQNVNYRMRLPISFRLN